MSRSPSLSSPARSSTVGSMLRYQPWWLTVSYLRARASTGPRVQSSSGTLASPAGQSNGMATSVELGLLQCLFHTQVVLGLLLARISPVVHVVEDAVEIATRKLPNLRIGMLF